MLAIALLAAAAAPFPERVPGMVEACVRRAVTEGDVSETPDSHKYICGGDTAAALWDWLEQARVESWEQDTAAEGRWLSRAFPLGACFKRLRDAAGRAATTGLSCTIWIPRPSDPSPAPVAPRPRR
jgi:hypothetical protein